jgi:N6-adenosine-specific RNA methylase IME4
MHVRADCDAVVTFKLIVNGRTKFVMVVSSEQALHLVVRWHPIRTCCILRLCILQHCESSCHLIFTAT